MQTLLSRPEMVYPGSQVQWVVPWVMVQRDGRTWEPAVAAGSVDAAAVSDMFVIVMKTGEKTMQKKGIMFVCLQHCHVQNKQAEPHTGTAVTYHLTLTHKSSSKSGLLNFNACFRGKFDLNIKAYTVWLWMCCLHVGRGVWQVAPDQPLLHTQENWLTSSTHVPPLRHGEEAHSLISDWKEEGWMAKVDFGVWTGTAEQMILTPVYPSQA